VVGSTSHLSPLNSEIERIIEKNSGRAKFHFIDSESISAGQGYLVNKTINLIKSGMSPQKIDETIRESITDIYCLLCSPNLDFLHSSAFLDAGQLISGEQQGIIPIYSLENGRINPLEKCKNLRGITDFFIEFLEEFETVDELCFIHPKNSKLPVFPEVKQFALENLSVSLFTEYNQNQFLANLIGPDGFGLILIE
jgi:fatty acid-binding protein DegV